MKEMPPYDLTKLQRAFSFVFSHRDDGTVYTPDIGIPDLRHVLYSVVHKLKNRDRSYSASVVSGVSVVQRFLSTSLPIFYDKPYRFGLCIPSVYRSNYIHAQNIGDPYDTGLSVSCPQADLFSHFHLLLQLPYVRGLRTLGFYINGQLLTLLESLFLCIAHRSSDALRREYWAHQSKNHRILRKYATLAIPNMCQFFLLCLRSFALNPRKEYSII